MAREQRKDYTRMSRDELQQELEQRDIDASGMSEEDMRSTLRQYEKGRMRGET